MFTISQCLRRWEHCSHRSSRRVIRTLIDLKAVMFYFCLMFSYRAWIMVIKAVNSHLFRKAHTICIEKTFLQNYSAQYPPRWWWGCTRIESMLSSTHRKCRAQLVYSKRAPWAIVLVVWPIPKLVYFSEHHNKPMSLSSATSQFVDSHLL